MRSDERAKGVSIAAAGPLDECALSRLDVGWI
jgi:hypothetical protein